MIRLGPSAVDRAQAELVLAELIELAPSGVEEVEISADGDRVRGLRRARASCLSCPTCERRPAARWWRCGPRRSPTTGRERWRSFHRPLVLGDRLTVRPPWEPAGETALDVVIDPGQAFGTGAHATTRLCLELMLERERPRGSFVDVGLRLGGAGDRRRQARLRRR